MKKLITTSLLAGLAFAAVSVFAQEPQKPGCPMLPPPPPPMEKGQMLPPPPPPMEKGKMNPKMKGFAETKKAEETLKAKYAKEMAEIEALRKEAKEKMQAANAKFVELAKKEGMNDLPCVKMEEFKAKMAEKKAKWDAFNKKYEKELNEIKELRKTDKKAAHDKMAELLKKEGIECPKFGPKGPKGPECKGPKGPECKGPKGPECKGPECPQGPRPLIIRGVNGETIIIIPANGHRGPMGPKGPEFKGPKGPGPKGDFGKPAPAPVPVEPAPAAK